MKLLLNLLRHAQRRSRWADLMALDDHLLHDIGLTRTDLATMMTGADIRHRGTSHA
ncbi:MAG TPA: DUF1127 domain-containing protein [Devosia sp.]|nr:DUF1127 domain-containing protein [Devosia sp.]